MSKHRGTQKKISNGFHRRGVKAAEWDFNHEPKYFGDIPAILTATYNKSPTLNELVSFARGYIETSRKLGVSEDYLSGESIRFINFTNGYTCETHFFGKNDPQVDRRG